MAATKKTTEGKETTEKKKSQKSVKAAEGKTAFSHTEQKHVERLPEENAEQLRERLQKEIDDYEIEVSKANDIQEMEKDYAESRMRKTEYLESLKLTNYKLQETVSHNGKDVTRKEVGDKIVFFLTKEPVSFGEITLLKSLVEYWSEPKDEIPFETYDKTVKFLDKMKYRGIPEWDGILMVSAFFRTMSEEYTKTNTIISYWDAKARVLENRAKEISGK